MNKINNEYVKAAFIRSLRTMAQTALAMFSVGQAWNEIDWMGILSVSIVAAVYSLLTSIATTLPEASYDGELVLEAGEDKEIYSFLLEDLPETLANQTSVRVKVVDHRDE